MTDYHRQWDSNSVDILRRLFDDGRSASVIATKVNRSRNAVLGKILRLRLHRESKPTVTAAIKPRGQHKPQLLVQPMVESPVISPDTERSPVPFLATKKWMCRAILNARGPNGEVMCCGAPQVRFMCDGGFVRQSSWCLKHFKIFTTAPKPRM